MMGKRLYRSRTDKKLTGLCGGIGHFLEIDPTLVRIAVVLLTVFTGVPLLIYVVLAAIVPKEPLFAAHESAVWEEFGPTAPGVSELDREIDRIEKRALQQEVQRLRAELAKWQTGGAK